MEDPNSLVDAEQIQKEYQRGLVITQARPLLARLLTIGWTALDAGLILLMIFVCVWYLASGQFHDRALTAELVENQEILHENALERSAASLLIGDTTVLRSDDAYDFHTELANPNEDWFAQFSFSFVTSGGETESQEGFIFPGQTKSLVALHQAFDGAPSNAELSVTNLSWTRMNDHLVERSETWYEDHADFALSESEQDMVFVAGKNVARSSFTIENNSAYGYWSVPLLLVLKRNGAVVGVNKVSVAGFEAGESRSVEVNWFDSTPASGDLSVEVDLNYLNEDVYMEAQASAQTDVRDTIEMN